MQPAIQQFLDTATEGFDGNYARALHAAILTASTAAAQQDNLAKFSRAWAVTVVADGLKEPQAVIDTAAALNSPCQDVAACRTWLVTELQAKGLAGPPVRVSDTGVVQVVSPATGKLVSQFDLGELAQAALKRPVDAQRAALKRDADALLGQLGADQGAARSRLIAALPDVDFDSAVGPVLTNLEVGEAAAAVQAIAPPEAEGGVLERTAASFALGRDLAQQTVLKGAGGGSRATSAPARPPGPGPATPPPEPVAPAMTPEEQAALAALSATGPYGMVAAVAIKALSSMAALASFAEQAGRLDQEDRGLTVELMHLAPLRVEVDHDEALATLAQRTAQAPLAGASCCRPRCSSRARRPRPSRRRSAAVSPSPSTSPSCCVSGTTSWIRA